MSIHCWIAGFTFYSWRFCAFHAPSGFSSILTRLPWFKFTFTFNPSWFSILSVYSWITCLCISPIQSYFFAVSSFSFQPKCLPGQTQFWSTFIVSSIISRSEWCITIASVSTSSSFFTHTCICSFRSNWSIAITFGFSCSCSCLFACSCC